MSIVGWGWVFLYLIHIPFHKEDFMTRPIFKLVLRNVALITLIMSTVLIPQLSNAENVTATVATGAFPLAIAINPVTNRVYVANYSSNSITVIDGATNFTSNVGVGTNPYAVAANPVTNMIYVANMPERK
jgi:YVTN family beta-propeller protein